MVGDGDTRSIMDIWDTNGICTHSAKVKDFLYKRTSDEYEEWPKTENECWAVRKIDCIQ